MSEKPSKSNHEEFDPLAESRRRANAGRQIYDKFMLDDVGDLSVEDRVKGHDDFASYLESRPSRDSRGKARNPEGGGFMSEEKAGEVYTPASAEFTKGEETDEYKNMSVSELAKRSAKAELRGDRTTMLSVDDAIQEKVDGMGLSESLTERDGTPRERSEKEIVLDRILKERQDYIDKINGWRDRKQKKEDGVETIIDEPEDDKDDKKPEGEQPGGEKEDVKPEDEKPEEFNPWVEFGEVMKEVSDEAVSKEVGANLDDEAMGRIAEIARRKIEDRMPSDEDEYYSGGELEPGGEQEPNREISDTTLEALGISRTRYAELSALRRGETLGKSKEELAEAKHNYEIALKQANQELMQILMETEGMTPDQARMIILDSSLEENKKLMQEIAEKRVENSSNKRFSRFYKWFGSQQGFKGRIKKGLATAAITAPLGLAAGAVGLAMLGPIAGAVAGAALARGVARGIALSKINKEAASVNLATTEGREDLQEAERSLISWMQTHPGETPPPSIITGVAEQTTRERLSENRKRTAKLMTIGALVATASAFAANLLFGGGGGGGGVHETPNGNGPIDMPGNTGPGTVPRVPGPIDMPGNTGPGTVPIPKIDFLPPETIPTGSFRYPWGWASETFGKSNATPMLKTLIKRAQDAGENVRWNPNPGGVRYIEVNGASDTKTVVDLLKQFVKPGELKGGPSLPSTL